MYNKDELEKNYLSVNYSELRKNWNNPKWSGWPNAKLVMDKLYEIGKPSVAFPNKEDWLKRLVLFYNNYELENAIISAFPELRWLTEDHDKLYCYVGQNLPDFIDKENNTYELKSICSWDSYYSRIDKMNWHGSKVGLIFNRQENKLYLYKVATDEKIDIGGVVVSRHVNPKNPMIQHIQDKYNKNIV